MRRRAAILILLLASGCVRMGEPTDEERQQLAAWSRVVSEKDRAEVRRAANSRTEWMERRKVQFMIAQYRSRYARAHKQSASRPAKPAAAWP